MTAQRDAVVEAMARALWDEPRRRWARIGNSPVNVEFDDADETTREIYRKDASAALDAALPLIVGPLRELADEAIGAIDTGGHSHWRSGGVGGSCSSCDRATNERDRLRAILDALPGGQV